MSREEAHASWNGFNYQGKIAILVTLEKMNSLDKAEYDNWSLEIEGIDDFALKKGDSYDSLHQVKNYNKQDFSSFKDALCKLGNKRKGIKKYFHTRLGLPQDWKNQLEVAIAYYELYNEEKIEEYKQEYLKFYEVGSTRKKQEVKVKSTQIAKIIKKGLSKTPIKCEDQLELSIIKEILKQHNEKNNIDINNLDEHATCSKIDSDEVIKNIKNNIFKLWGTETAKLKSDNIDLYYQYLILEIDKLISDRAEKENKNKEIAFSKIEKLINKKSFSDEEGRVLEYVAKIQDVYEEFCPGQCDVSVNDMYCSQCNLGQIVKSIVTAQPCDVLKILRVLDISNADDIKNKSQELTNKDKLSDILYEIISRVNKTFHLQDYKIISNMEKEEKFVMASTLQNTKQYKIGNIISNKQIDSLFSDVSIEYEIDEIITKDIDCSLGDLKPKIYGELENEDSKSYFKITKNKNVKLITFKEACQKYGDRKNGI